MYKTCKSEFLRITSFASKLKGECIPRSVTNDCLFLCFYPLVCLTFSVDI